LIYIIATTPRTGGHFLCALLAGTGVCGHPSEYFLRRTELWRNRSRCRTRQQYLEFYLNEGLTTNGVIGAKLTWSQFCEFTAELGRNPFLRDQERASLLEERFGHSRYLFLRRRDRLRQAISYSRALQTGLWNSMMAARKRVPGAEIFDIDAIDELVQAINVEESRWLAYFHEAGVNPLTLYYEDLVDQPRTWIAEILDFLEIDHQSLGPCQSRLQRQSDELTEEWVKRYRSRTASPEVVRAPDE
jgi:trehalose 2-sulfotransferase